MEESGGRIIVSPFPPVTLPEGGMYQFIHGKLLEFGSRTALVSAAILVLLGECNTSNISTEVDVHQRVG